MARPIVEHLPEEPFFQLSSSNAVAHRDLGEHGQGAHAKRSGGSNGHPVLTLGGRCELEVAPGLANQPRSQN